MPTRARQALAASRRSSPHPLRPLPPARRLPPTFAGLPPELRATARGDCLVDLIRRRRTWRPIEVSALACYASRLLSALLTVSAVRVSALNLWHAALAHPLNAEDATLIHRRLMSSVDRWATHVRQVICESPKRGLRHERACSRTVGGQPAQRPALVLGVTEPKDDGTVRVGPGPRGRRPARAANPETHRIAACPDVRVQPMSVPGRITCPWCCVADRRRARAEHQ